MIETSQKKIDIYTKYLRKMLIEDGYKRVYVNSLSNDQILSKFRTCCDCDEEVITEGQQLRTILEFDSPERIQEVIKEMLEEQNSKDKDELYLLLDEDGCEFEENECDCGECNEANEDFEVCNDCYGAIRLEIDPLDEDLEVIRAKWALDGSESLDAAIANLTTFLVYLQDLKKDGYELIEPIEDDYGYLTK
jgi:hypothetical protein